MASGSNRKETPLFSLSRLHAVLAATTLIAILLFIPADAGFLLEAIFFTVLALAGLEGVRLLSSMRAKQSVSNQAE